MYWTTRGDLTTAARALVEHRRAQVITIDGADVFFDRLAEKVETLESMGRLSDRRQVSFAEDMDDLKWLIICKSRSDTCLGVTVV